MSRFVLALGILCVWSGWSQLATAQQPFYGSAYGASYPSHHHHGHVPQPNYGSNFGGYGLPGMGQPNLGFGGYGTGYPTSPGYGMGGYPSNNYYPPAPQPNYGQHHHHHHQAQPVYQPPYQPPYQQHPWHLGHYLLGT